MSKILDDAVLFGFGMFSYSREKIEEIVEKMVEKGKVAKTEASDFAKELIKKGEAEKDEIKKMLESEISKMSEKMPISREEIREIIREELENLKK